MPSPLLSPPQKAAQVTDYKIDIYLLYKWETTGNGLPLLNVCVKGLQMRELGTFFRWRQLWRQCGPPCHGSESGARDLKSEMAEFFPREGKKFIQ